MLEGAPGVAPEASGSAIPKASARARLWGVRSNRNEPSCSHRLPPSSWGDNISASRRSVLGSVTKSRIFSSCHCFGISQHVCFHLAPVGRVRWIGDLSRWLDVCAAVADTEYTWVARRTERVVRLVVNSRSKGSHSAYSMMASYSSRYGRWSGARSIRRQRLTVRPVLSGVHGLPKPTQMARATASICFDPSTE